jgi:hypothetical protein
LNHKKKHACKEREKGKEESIDAWTTRLRMSVLTVSPAEMASAALATTRSRCRSVATIWGLLYR